MKIGDKREHKVVKLTGNYKKDVLALFDKMTEQDEEERLLNLEKRKREVNEAAKRLF